jgi:hypothetical protein
MRYRSDDGKWRADLSTARNVTWKLGQVPRDRPDQCSNNGCSGTMSTNVILGVIIGLVGVFICVLYSGVRYVYVTSNNRCREQSVNSQFMHGSV